MVPEWVETHTEAALTTELDRGSRAGPHSDRGQPVAEHEPVLSLKSWFALLLTTLSLQGARGRDDTDDNDVL